MCLSIEGFPITATCKKFSETGCQKMSTPRSKVLIVDDDVATIRLIAEALATDYEVIIATDAEEGLEQAQKVVPH